MSKYLAIRKRGLSVLLDKKALTVVGLLLLFSLTLAILSLGVGDMWIPPLEVAKSLLGFGSEMHPLVVQSFRLPRLLLSFLAGAMLAVSGAVLHAVIRNPLASPDIIGITGGATFATVSFLAAFSDRSNSLIVSIHWLPLASFTGALAITLLVYALAWKNGVTPIRLVLIGIGLAEAMRALTTTMIVFGPLYLATQAHIWMAGSVNGANWGHVLTLFPWTVVLIGCVLIFAYRLNVQELGIDLASSVGSPVPRQRMIFLFGCAALAGGAVAFAGAIGFVGLMGPHIARKLVGSSHGALVPTAALIGGCVVMGADLMGRTLFLPLEVPAGVFTSAIGAPYFIYLLFRERNR